MCYSLWEDEAQGVIYILTGPGGNHMGTASLINCSCQNFIPYILSARHVSDYNEDGILQAGDIEDAENASFMFKHYRPQCGSGQSSTITYNHSIFRASWWKTDFILLEMEDRPSASSDIKYLGMTGIGAGMYPVIRRQFPIPT